MVDLKHKYALLENGVIEPLHYPWGELRAAYYSFEDDKFYLDHDVWGTFMGYKCVAYRHDEILATSDCMDELEVLFDGEKT